MENKWPKFAHPPIVEALLDIRADLPPETDLGLLASLQKSIKELYPIKRDHYSWQADFRVGAGTVGLKKKSGGQDGYLFRSGDGRQIVQARLNGFTFNRLRPYKSWALLRDEAREHWKLFAELAVPKLRFL